MPPPSIFEISFGSGDLVEQRVAPDAEDDVGEHEIEAGVAVPAVPDGQAVEADEPLEPGDSREQDHLEEREVGAQQPREARDAVSTSPLDRA